MILYRKRIEQDFTEWAIYRIILVNGRCWIRHVHVVMIEELLAMPNGRAWAAQEIHLAHTSLMKQKERT